MPSVCNLCESNIWTTQLIHPAQCKQDCRLFSSSCELFLSSLNGPAQGGLLWSKQTHQMVSFSTKKKKFSISGPNIHIFIGCVRCDICTSHLFIEILSRRYWITVPTTFSSKLIKTYVIILARFPTNHFIKAASSNRRNVIPLKKQICWIRFNCSFLLPSYYI